MQNPYDLLGSNRMMHVGVGPVYDRVLCKGLIRTFAAHRDVLARRTDLPAWDRVSASQTVLEFDDRHTRRAFGYASVEDYYRQGSSKNAAHKIAVPLLFLIAEDDQLLDYHRMDLTSLVRANPNVIAAVTKRGGHVAWHESIDARRQQWVDRVTVEFFASVLRFELGLP
jgi:predicted alpha/beta-fold hydrolase